MWCFDSIQNVVSIDHYNAIILTQLTMLFCSIFLDFTAVKYIAFYVGKWVLSCIILINMFGWICELIVNLQYTIHKCLYACWAVGGCFHMIYIVFLFNRCCICCTYVPPNITFCMHALRHTFFQICNLHCIQYLWQGAHFVLHATWCNGIQLHILYMLISVHVCFIHSITLLSLAACLHCAWNKNSWLVQWIVEWCTWICVCDEAFYLQFEYMYGFSSDV